MTLKQLRFLLGIADSGLNITAAATRLHTSQPGISKQLKLLEQELGVQLFKRRGKSLVEITPAGREVIERARRIMSEVANIGALADNLAAEASGTLSIATTHTQARYVLPDIIAKFRERYPQIKLELHQGTSEQIRELVESDQVDIAMATGSREIFPDLALLPCFFWRRIVVVPTEHELADSTGPLALQTLAEHPLVTYVFSGSGESSFKTAFAKQGLTPNVVFTARDADVIKTYVRIGMGVGVMAPMAFECDDRRDLVALDASDCLPSCTTWIGLRRDQVLRRYTADFASLVAPHLDVGIVARALEQESQAGVDRLFDDVVLPEQVGCLEPIEV